MPPGAGFYDCSPNQPIIAQIVPTGFNSSAVPLLGAKNRLPCGAEDDGQVHNKQAIDAENPGYSACRLVFLPESREIRSALDCGFGAINPAQQLR
jgi:hypothetical protein